MPMLISRTGRTTFERDGVSIRHRSARGVQGRNATTAPRRETGHSSGSCPIEGRDASCPMSASRSPRTSATRRDIHPRNKREVGRRLGLWALAEAYDRPTEGYESPSLEKAEKVAGPDGGSAMRITFNQTGAGLKTRDEKAPNGFALSGPDGKFQWANAKIEDGGRSVLVWSADVPDPAGVCFAWQNNPVRANLVNSAGLPADPFRIESSSQR